MVPRTFEIEVGERKLTIEIGRLAGQASGAVTIKYGDTVTLVTAVISKSVREGIDYLPLLVDYEERYYAAGKIKGSRFIKREGKPSDEAIVTARLVDRVTRPLFDQSIRNDIQVVVTVLSHDGENDPDVLGLIGASLSLMISEIPWGGPIAACRVGRVQEDGQKRFVINPTYEQREKGDLDLVIAATKERIVMIEAAAKEIKEQDVIDAIELSKDYLGKIIAFQKSIAEELNPVKITPILRIIDSNIQELTKKAAKDQLESILFSDKAVQQQETASLKQELRNHFSDDNSLKQAYAALDIELEELFKEKVLKQEKRPDGRKLKEIRPLDIEVGLLPRTHGSGLFSRGQTQALGVLTLGAPGDEQTLETMEMEGKKRFMLHYNFPPFCVGEVAPMRGPGRREIGHGSLAERALESLIPPQENFPYTMRLVIEVLSSNGSSSMASVCVGTLALMDAGVPIKKPAAGISIGIVQDKDTGDFKLLSDIQGVEDHFGGMDFKVAGTKDGITAIQMDIKDMGINMEMLKGALSQAKENREFILDKMAEIISAPRINLSSYAPRIITLKINPDRIREVIGTGGKVINEIIDATGVKIDIDDDGLVFITSDNEESGQKALDWIKNIVKEFKAGEEFKGKVTRILDFGAFVELVPGHEGMVHISELAPFRVNRVEDVIKIGDVVSVKVKEIDEKGRINLTMRGTDFDYSKVKKSQDGGHQKNNFHSAHKINRLKHNDFF